MDFREAVIDALGDFPRKPKPELEIMSSEAKDGFTLQSIEYNVEDSERVRAFLLIPEPPKEKLPAILAVHQHAVQYHLGKSEVVGLAGSPMYAYGLELCRRGYVVLAPDHLCFEERIAPHFRNRPENDRRYELFEFMQRVQNGSCLQTKYLHDLTVAVDVLQSLSYVDDNRIGVVGHSLGGQEATWLMWYDRRVAAGVSSCGISQIEAMFRDNIILSYSMYVPGFSRLGDMCDIVAGIAPRPFFMSSGLQDTKSFPIDGIEHITEMAKSKYAQLGSPNSFRSIIFDGGHMFGDDVKKEAYEWLDSCLGHRSHLHASFRA